VHSARHTGVLLRKHLLLLFLSLAVPGVAEAKSFTITGVAGYLSEWELSGTVTEIASTQNEFSGSLSMKHIGLCSVNGPEVKAANIKFQITTARASRSNISATVTIDGAPCTFGGPFSENYSGRLDCPSAKGVPLQLLVK
jgi:hypothetical protein